MKKLERGIAVGAVWLLSLKFLMRGIGILSTFLLVRLLSPEDFGLNAIAMSIFGFVELLSRFGFDTVLIQKQDATERHYDTAWSFNVSFGLLACVLILLSSPFIATFYGDQRLYSVLLCVSVLFLLNGFLNVGIVDFRKNLTFDKEFKLQILPKVISFIVTVALAFYYRNYWALVIGTLVWKGLICLMSYIMSPYRPKFRFTAWRELFQFSKWIFFGNFLNFFNIRTPELFVGKIISPAAAGYISIATEISDFATSELISNVNRAAYPGYSKISSDLVELKKLYFGIMSNISFWAFPAGFGLSVTSSLLVPVVFGPQWSEVIVLIEYLAIASMIFSLNSNSSYIFLAVAKPKMTVVISMIRVAIFLPLLVTLLYLEGILGVAHAVLIASLITFFIYNYAIRIELKSSFFDLAKIHLRPLVSSLSMTIGIVFLKESMLEYGGLSNLAMLVLCVLSGVFMYSFSTLFLWFLGGTKNGPERFILTFLQSKFRSS